MKLNDFLATKPMFYKEIDYTRMPRAWASIKDKLRPFKVIHIVGTNGKGSTGRFLAQILSLSGKSVGHYTSPHIFSFNERFWLNGENVSDEKLNNAHEKLQEFLDDEFKIKTSYFEYATLLSAVLFSECDFFVCETGMGGEYDATNVFDKLFSIFTPISIDHTDVLGKDLVEISKTKFKSMQSDTLALISNEMNPECIKIALDIATKRNVRLRFGSEKISEEEREEAIEYIRSQNMPEFLANNFLLACGAARTAVGKLHIVGLKPLDLRARCEKIAHNLYVDVGHNEAAAMAILQNFKNQKITLIFNSFADKDYKKTLEILKPITKKVLIYDYDSINRALAKDGLKNALNELNIEHENFKNFDILNVDEIFLVFGSFYLVEAFLRAYKIAS
ncbi:bifunctional folylpolyglutamate synthase/dihydrofolate synthase [Campylobacter majalis]|uniref:bifunctional folylpolyglutamate synthase/dihydrofolate synthase n=1 Tax=Campylobacter majalis TaxID=2790656 RepID=UPI003D6970DD